MPVVAALTGGAEATQALRRSLPAASPWTVTACRTIPQLRQLFATRLVDAVIFSPVATPPADLAPLRALPEWKALMKKHFPDQIKD